MAITSLIKLLLEKQNIPYSTITAPGRTASGQWLTRTVAMENLATLELLEDEAGLVLPIFPASRVLNLDRLNRLLHRHLAPMDPDRRAALLAACESATPETVEGLCNPQIIVDVMLSDQDYIHFLSPDNSGLIRFDAAHVQLLADHLLIGSSISDPRGEDIPPPTASGEIPRLDLRTAVKRLDRLPPMPELAARILRMRSDPDTTVAQLSEVVAEDPALAAHVVRYANSAFFGQSGKIDSIEDAVFRVLGFEGVVNLALGLALAGHCAMPANGPLGRERFWIHATYTATLAQRLAEAVPRELNVKPGTAYLAGLLHDLGYMVLHQLFSSEFFWLTKVATARPEVPLRQLERQLLGVEHTELGELLMKAWKMPGEVTAVVRHHHDMDYRGDHLHYVRIVLLADRLLKAHDLSDADSEELPAALLETLGLEEEAVLTLTDEVLAQDQALKEIVAALCA